MANISQKYPKMLSTEIICISLPPQIMGKNKFNCFKIMNYLTSEKKQEIFGQYGKSNADTGSPESQVALFSYRIAHLTNHLKSNKKDYATQRSLLKMVGKRRRLLDYLKATDIERYRNIVKALNLRK